MNLSSLTAAFDAIPLCFRRYAIAVARSFYDAKVIPGDYLSESIDSFPSEVRNFENLWDDQELASEDRARFVGRLPPLPSAEKIYPSQVVPNSQSANYQSASSERMPDRLPLERPVPSSHPKDQTSEPLRRDVESNNLFIDQLRGLIGVEQLPTNLTIVLIGGALEQEFGERGFTASQVSAVLKQCGRVNRKKINVTDSLAKMASAKNDRWIELIEGSDPASYRLARSGQDFLKSILSAVSLENRSNTQTRIERQ